MVPSFHVLANCPDPDDEDDNEPAECVLRVMDEMLVIGNFFPHKERGYWSFRKLRLFRGSWLLKRLLTPLFCIHGILFSMLDISWIEAEAGKRRLRITPAVPPDFWLDIHFKTEEDANAVAALIDQWRIPAGDRHRPLSWRLQRWTEAFVAAVFLIPVAVGFMVQNGSWIGASWGAAIVIFVVGGMILGWRRDIRDQQSWQRELPAISKDAQFD